MSDMFEYLDSVAQAANSHSSAIEAQLGESVEALRDMEKMQPTLSHLDGVVKELQGFFDEAHIEVGFDWLLCDLTGTPVSLQHMCVVHILT